MKNSYIMLYLHSVYIALVFAWGIYDVQCSITHAKPDHGVLAQVYVITCFKYIHLLFDLMTFLKIVLPS